MMTEGSQNKQKNNVKEKLDISSLYTPLSEAKEEVWRRWNDKALRRKYEDAPNEQYIAKKQKVGRKKLLTFFVESHTPRSVFLSHDIQRICQSIGSRSMEDVYQKRGCTAHTLFPILERQECLRRQDDA